MKKKTENSRGGEPIAEKTAPAVVSSESYFLPYQDAWIDDEAPFKLAEKSRRVGFTYATSYRCFRKCLTRQNFTQWVSSRDLLTAKEFITDYIARWCRLGNVVAKGLAGENVLVFDPDKDVRAFVVEFPTGSRIVSLSSTPEVFAGKGGDVLLDELDLHKDQGKVYDMARPCTTWGGQLEIISAYAVDGSPTSDFARLCKDARQSNPMNASLHRVSLDDAIAQGFVECVGRVTGKALSREAFRAQIRAGCRNEAAFQSQFMCNPQDDGGALIPYGLIAACEVGGAETPGFEGAAPLFLGIDVGRKHDLTVFWLLRRIGDVFWTEKVVVLEKTPFRAQLERASLLIRQAGVTRCCIDATGIGAMMAEELQREHGLYRVEAIAFTNAVKIDLGMPLRGAFEDRAIRIPSAPEIREDLHKVRKTVTAAGNIRLEAESDEAGHADRFWALALALHAGAAPEAGFAPVPFETAHSRARAARSDRSVAA